MDELEKLMGAHVGYTVTGMFEEGSLDYRREAWGRAMGLQVRDMPGERGTVNIVHGGTMGVQAKNRP